MDDDGHSFTAPKITRGSCLCGAVHWEFRGEIPDATICNCTACRRYGVLWAYDHDGYGISVEDPSGNLVPYLRGAKVLSFNFCKVCGNVVSWRATTTGKDGRVRIAVNLRLAEPEDVANIPVLRFEGLHSFEDLPMDGRTVGDIWF
ncbi:GFA family protein [Agrobacterium larrymoorei]|uniref:GFA family protein n=1 Tax=Agrobacterium larrymoorei TaxID=160699 RepID=UPI0015735789|nr:GFA family protein [Agrobacterium larrymoorei]NTJ43128.1 GFA family protein [Agrobacterium larrymoorei]